MVAVLLVAMWLRLWGLGFGLPHANARPDETGVAGPAVEMLSGDFRPPSFNKPTLFVYEVAAAYAAYFVLSSPFTSYATLDGFAASRRQNIAPFLYISRALSALMGVLTVWWLYSLTRRATGDEAVALLAAAWLAVTFLHVRDSHFGVTDVPMTGLVVLAVREILIWCQSGAWARALTAGVVGGLAMSVKYNGLGVVVPFAVAAVVRVRDTQASPDVWRQVARDAGLFALAFAVIFLAGSPYILIDQMRFLRDVSAQENVLTLGHGMAVARGWWYHAAVTLPTAVGWPLFLVSLAGAVGFLAARFRPAAVVMAFPVAYYLVAGYGYTVFARYMIPVLPFLCLTGAWGIVTAVRAAGPKHPLAQATLLATVPLIVAAPSLIRTIQTDRLLSRPDNRVIVADAIRALVPTGASVYQSGAAYGHVQLPADRSLHDVSSADMTAALHGGKAPDFVLLQRSPLSLYSSVSTELLDFVQRGYSLVQAFPVGDDRPRLYDQQDAFFLPLTGLRGIVRPGPAFELYRRAQ